MAQTLRRPRLLVPIPARRRSGLPRVRARSFAAAYAVLALLVAGAAAAAFVLATMSAHHPRAHAVLTPAQTAGLGTYAMKATAFAVQNEYHVRSGGTLVAIVARPSSPPQFVTPSGPVAISALVVHPGFAIESSRDIRAYDVSKAALFVMCGVAADCRIPGAPSAVRGALLEREALELTLRTLEHVQSVDSVLIFVPPASQKRVVYLTRGDLSKQLNEPLSKSLPPLHADVQPSLTGGEQRGLAALLAPHTFTVRGIDELPDGSAYLSAVPSG